MEYRVEALASATGVGVDTIRFYQGRGLLDPPTRRGRVAYYGEPHVERLRRIRDLQGQGFSLDQIQKVLASEQGEDRTLLQALVDARVGNRTWTLSELAAESGVPEVLLRAAIQTGLLEPLDTDGEPRFSEADVEIARVGMDLLKAGFPLHLLLQQATAHNRNIRETCDAAIELFDDHVRKGGETAGDLHAITDQFQQLLPMVTRLVAMHFQRTLVTRALQRLDGSEERDALEAALEALDRARLEVEGRMAIDALPPPEEKRAAVKAMFDRIAPRYDALNRIMTLGLDQRWRSRALDAAEVGADDILVDLACGTGDLAEQAAARGAQVIGVDFAREMLRGAQRRLEGVSLAQGDGAALPFATSSATVLTCGFALRNFVELGQVFREMGRVLTPGGRLVLIEVDRPPSGVVRAGHSLYFDRVVPRVGGWLSDRAAYSYLPQSTSYLPGDDDLREMLELAGFSEITKQRLLLGTAQILIGVRS